jgi:hypothetical protein
MGSTDRFYGGDGSGLGYWQRVAFYIGRLRHRANVCSLYRRPYVTGTATGVFGILYVFSLLFFLYSYISPSLFTPFETCYLSRYLV